ncbi:MAG: alpha/beta hydrolase [Gammaproteobacteria bacterium]|nr:alpha/beta hydrolase [Gammaproteobacteria bacterium]
MAQVVDSFVTVGGVRSPCLQSGTAGEEAVVFIHGNPGSCEDWRALVAGVGEFGRALALDMPGFGRADKPADFDYTVAGYAAHLDAVLRQQGVRRVHLVLHDFGGPWGLAWAAAHAERVASVTLFNIGILPAYRWHFMARLWRTPLLGELVQATTTWFGFRMLMKLGNPRGLPDNFVQRMYRDFDAGTRRAVLKLYRATGPAEIERFCMEVTAALRPRRIPALVLWGARDPYIPERYADIQREVFPDVLVRRLADSGHWAFADNPEAVGAAVLPFLRQQLSGST